MGVTSVITPQVITHLASMEHIRNEYAFLKFVYKIKDGKPKRSCCGTKARSSRMAAQAVETAMASIAHMPAERLLPIKKALGVDTIVVNLIVNGKHTTYTRA